ncbi:hypothetical protein K435DRAFT_965070 [Dendrothele bispora CBS 962.96]|uniref:Uncharacterized protein n=1 Tax=Dendrothele bispora (strain CBS 962.96) TaxID=1314807 RepID=A0A4S8M781_DENBC|nr:hypothetical protein K435DRAFT_965070 [Dendrothele bispora CBS 962.96]
MSRDEHVFWGTCLPTVSTIFPPSPPHLYRLYLIHHPHLPPPLLSSTTYTFFHPLPPHALSFQALPKVPSTCIPHNFPKILSVIPKFSAFPTFVSILTLIFDLTTSTTTASLSLTLSSP